jgi:hypothetical protein
MPFLPKKLCVDVPFVRTSGTHCPGIFLKEKAAQNVPKQGERMEKYSYENAIIVENN